MNPTRKPQRGATLIEVLVAILILSFGVLALGSMLAFAVQLPKMAAYRATAVAIASGQVERMRANPTGFRGESYKVTMTFTGETAAHPTETVCAYPDCTAATLAALDIYQTKQLLRQELPAGGMRILCNGACTSLEGDIYVMWQEPSSGAALDSASSDECPVASVDPTFTPFTSPAPRCIHLKFKL